MAHTHSTKNSNEGRPIASVALRAAQDDGRLFTLIAQCRVGNRPGRIEPRMRNRRPKPCPWLKVPRAAHARRKIKIHGHDWEPK